jgi:hypothetical protein
MIFFFADNHYDSFPGRHIYEQLKADYDISFYEDDWSVMENDDFSDKCDLLILNMIGETCDVPHPSEAAEKQIRKYAENGGSFLLLHGSSAAFWKWAWWREIVGFRWVRPNDPDNAAKSTHPVKPYRVEVAKCRHELCSKLESIDLPADEIYTELEQTCPVSVLMQTKIEEGTFPQCYECATSWGGRIIGYLPGHKVEVTSSPEFICNIKVLLDYIS